ncbi:hypothetical protein ACGTN9_08680 [Halobacillus sp. MO56]
MIRLLDKTYVSLINGRLVKLVLLGENRCEIYINSQYRGIGPFNYIKEQINLLEKLQPRTRVEYIEDSVLFQELNCATIDMKI